MMNGKYARRDMIDVVDRILTPNQKVSDKLTSMDRLVLRIAEGHKKTQWKVEVMEDKNVHKHFSA